MNTGALEKAVRDLKSRKDTWADLPLKQKLVYLRGILDNQAEIAERQVTAAAHVKDVPRATPMEGEEWASGPYCAVRNLRVLHDTLKGLERTGRVQLKKGAVHRGTKGRAKVDVFPLSIVDRMLYYRFRGEVWMQEGVTPSNISLHMADFYRRNNPQGKVALVLGAANVTSIGLLDVIHKLYAEGQVCLFKNNPISWYMMPFLEKCFGELIRDGYVRLASGGADVGEYLCRHPDVDEIHLTGSLATYEAIVFGAGEEGAERKRRNEPRLAKRFTCELGNVSPVIVVPGPWKNRDVEFQAQNIATMMIHNNGFNCNAAKVLILPEVWPQARMLMGRIRSILESAPKRRAYYPGAEERYDEFIASLPTAQAVGERRPGYIPYTIVPNLDPEDKSNICYTTEAFFPMMAQTTLPGASAKEFLSQAVEFCNSTLWGNLNACIIVHPETAKMLGPFLDWTIDELRYGTIAINQWPALAYLWGTTTWGAYAGQPDEEIQSGKGFVHNAYLFDKPQKSVVYGPFRVFPKPTWFVTNRNSHRTLPKLVDLEARPRLSKILGVAASAIWG